MIGKIIWLFLRITFALLFYATPVIGFWLASSLAAYLGAPAWIAWTVGAMLFPLIPGVWEFHTWTWRDPNKKAWFTTLDRLSLKTFAVGLSFIVALLYFYPQTAFVALSTRGDWMLDGVKDKRAATARQYLFAGANGLEWLYKYSKKNPYTDFIDAQARKQTETAEDQIAQQHSEKDSSNQGKDDDDEVSNVRRKETATAGEETAVSGDETAERGDETAASGDETATSGDETAASGKKTADDAKNQIPDIVPIKVSRKRWPWKKSTIHPVVANMPRSAETSIKAVAKYIAQREKDPVLRIKALHDWVADRVAYDAASFYAGRIPDQSAQTTFKTRVSVCAGYANLLSALGDAINEKIVVVEGDARDSAAGDKLTGMGHAWNAAKVNGHWHLIDVCWDSGTVDRQNGFVKGYRTSYLMPPPEVMIADHFPDQSTWQLLPKPLTQGDFLRQPMLSPAFQSADLTLVTPQRARNEMGDKAIAVVKNPDNVWLMTGLEQNGKQLGESSVPTNNEMAHLEQDLPDKGTYRLNIFVNEKAKYGRYSYVGSIDYVNR